MTVAATYTPLSYNGNGVTVTFAASWRYLATAHLVVKRIAATGVVTVLVLGVDYSATAGPTDAGGSVTLFTPAATGARTTIARATPRAQGTDYTTGDTFPAETHELALDRLTLIAQEVEAERLAALARTLRVPEGETLNELGNAVARAGMVQGWNATGTQPLLLSSVSLAALVGALSLSGGVGYFLDEYGARYAWGIRNGLGAPVIAPHVYIDPVNGVDGRAGTSVSTSVKTLAGLLALTAIMGATGTVGVPTLVRNVTLGVIGHATQLLDLQLDFYVPSAVNGYRYMEACAVVAVGPNPAQFDCAAVVATGTIIVHASLPTTYEVAAWAHDMSGGAVSRFRVWDGVTAGDKPLARVSLEANVIAGTYWQSGDPDAGVARRIVFRLADSSDPRSNGRTTKITKRDRAVSLRGGLVQGVWVYRNGHNSGGIEVGRNTVASGDPSCLRSCLAVDGTKHNVVFGHGAHLDVIAVNCRDNDFDPGGETPSLFSLAQVSLLGESATLTRVWAIADTTIHGAGVAVGQNAAGAFLTHDNFANQALATLTALDCGTIGVAAGWDVWARDAIVIDGFYCPQIANPVNSAMIAVRSGDKATISGSYLGGKAGAGAYRWISGTRLTVRGNLFIQDGFISGGGLYSNGLAGVFGVENNVFSWQSGAAPFIEMAAGSTLALNRNVILRGAGPVSLSGAGNTITGDRNTFVGDGGGNIYTVVNGVSRDFAASVAALAIDANGSVETTQAGVGLLSGAWPTLASADIRPVAGGKMNTRQTAPLANDKIVAMLLRPTTLAQAQDYLRLDVNKVRLAVLG